MQSITTLGSLFLVTTIGSATLVPLPYNIYKEAIPMEHVKFSSLKANEYTLSCSASGIKDDDRKLSVIIGIAKDLVTGSSNIDPEFVDIVNDCFWEMI